MAHALHKKARKKICLLLPSVQVCHRWINPYDRYIVNTAFLANVAISFVDVTIFSGRGKTLGFGFLYMNKCPDALSI